MMKALDLDAFKNDSGGETNHFTPAHDSKHCN